MRTRPRASRVATGLAIAAAAAALTSCKGESGRTPPSDAGAASADAGARALELTTEDGVILGATLHPGPSAARGAIVLVHQLGSDRGEWAPVVDRLTAHHAVIAVDLRGHGDSTRTETGETLAWREFDASDWAALPNDVAAAVARARALSPAPVGVSVMGSSIGSSAALHHAANADGVVSVALLSPGLDYRGLETEPAVEQLGERPLLLLASEGDTGSAGAVSTLAEAAQHAETHIYSGGAHGVSIAEDEPALWADVVSFFTGVGSPAAP